MFFAFCNDPSATISADLRQQYHNRLPKITAALVHAAKNNWATLMLMMALDLRDDMGKWFTKRCAMEGTTATVSPSFELLGIALWLRNGEYLNALAANNGGVLSTYLALRNDETDVLGHTIWHFANWGLGAIFIAAAKQERLIPPLPRDCLCSQETSLPEKIKFPADELDILRLHTTTYCGDSQAVDAAVQRARGLYGSALFTKLASSGCWQGLLICIVAGWCDPITSRDPFTSEALEALQVRGVDVEFANTKAYWEKLQLMPRDDKITGRTSFTTYLENPTLPDVCFTYVVYQFLRRPERARGEEVLYTNPKTYYGKCLNILLLNCCKNPRPEVLELLCFVPQDVRLALNAETIAALKPHVQEFYPTAMQHLFPADAVVGEDIIPATPASSPMI